jgi:hypothetical protein
MAFDSGGCLRDRFSNVRQRIGWLFPKTRRVGKTYQDAPLIIPRRAQPFNNLAQRVK